MAGSTTASDDEEYVKGVIQIAKDKALAPLHAALSKPARRAYIQTALLLLGSCALFAAALAAYSVFYYAYVPTRGFAVPVHLQFHTSSSNPRPNIDNAFAEPPPQQQQHQHPWGTATGLRKWLVSEQPYDVRVELDMPRTRANREAGNFMLDVALVGPAPAEGQRGGGATTVGDGIAGIASGAPSPSPSGPRAPGIAADEAVLARSSRPAILTWYSDVVENVGRAAALPWYLIGWRREAERLVVGVLEGVSFERGSWRRLPDKVRVEVRAVERLQVYGCWVVFEARLGGLRYFMYNFRLTAAIVFTTAFWVVGMTFMILAWLALSRIFAQRPPAAKPEPKAEDETDVKTEEGETETTDVPELSDTPRTFPSYAGQPSLRYESPRVKSEEEEPSGVPRDVPPAGGQEADDEDEDADFVLDTAGRQMERDSGLGTSMESGQERREAVRKRRSGLFGSGSRNQ